MKPTIINDIYKFILQFYTRYYLVKILVLSDYDTETLF